MAQCPLPIRSSRRGRAAYEKKGKPEAETERRGAARRTKQSAVGVGIGSALGNGNWQLADGAAVPHTADRGLCERLGCAARDVIMWSDGPLGKWETQISDRLCR